jgi:hypothetical protein
MRRERLSHTAWERTVQLVVCVDEQQPQHQVRAGDHVEPAWHRQRPATADRLQRVATCWRLRNA